MENGWRYARDYSMRKNAWLTDRLDIVGQQEIMHSLVMQEHEREFRFYFISLENMMFLIADTK